MLDLVGNPKDRFSHNEAHTGCFIICVTIKECYGFFENAKIYQRLTQPCSRHSKVLLNV